MGLKIDRRSFPEARLIIGNGFDLKVGLHSSYKNYFKYKANDYLWFKHTLLLANENYNTFDNYDINNFPNELPDNLNIWDYVFYALSTKAIVIEYWCDVEKVIQKCLFSEDWILSLCKLANNLRALMSYKNKYLSYDQADIFFIKHLILNKIRKGIIFDEKSFYQYLKRELKRFESSFIAYLDEETKKIDYPMKAKGLVANIMGKDEYNITQIDSFNYTGFTSKHMDFFNINGDMSFPIFGVDSSQVKDSNDERRIFTKQYRRLERILISDPKPSTCGDECIYFYGHSLNEQDYDYFFTLFDRLNLLNEFDRRLVFAYSLYDKGKKEIIEKNLLDAIYALFFTYEKSKGVESPKLVTSLISEGKIVIKIV